jgi:hypothetical protein
VTHPAVELYCMATGVDLADQRAAALEQMLATGEDAKWTNREVMVSDRQVLEARALAGLFLYNEDVVWSFSDQRALLAAFRWMADCIARNDALSAYVRRVDRANGAQGVRLHSGRHLLFMRHGGPRGMSADCYLLDEAEAVGMHDRMVALLCGSGRPNPQLITCL